MLPSQTVPCPPPALASTGGEHWLVRHLARPQPSTPKRTGRQRVPRDMDFLQRLREAGL